MSNVRLKTRHLACGASTPKCQLHHSSDTDAHAGMPKVLVLPDQSAILIEKELARHHGSKAIALLPHQSTTIGASPDQLQVHGTWHDQLVALITHGA